MRQLAETGQNGVPGHHALIHVEMEHQLGQGHATGHFAVDRRVTP